MTDDYEHTGSSIHPAIAERFNRLDAELREVEGKCDRRHRDYGQTFATTRDRCEKHDRRLVSIAGEQGDNGKLAQLAREVSDVKNTQEKHRRLLWTVILATLSTTGLATAITQALIHAANK